MEAKVFIIYVHLLCEQKSSQKNTELEKPFLESVSGKYHFSTLDLYHLALTQVLIPGGERKCKSHAQSECWDLFSCSVWEMHHCWLLWFFLNYCTRISNTQCFLWSWISLLIIKINSTIGTKLMLHQQCSVVGSFGASFVDISFSH